MDDKPTKKRIPIRKIIIIVFYILAVLSVFFYLKEKKKSQELQAQNNELQQSLDDERELTEIELSDYYNYYYDLGYRDGINNSNYQKGYDDAISSYQEELDDSYNRGYDDGFFEAHEDMDVIFEENYNYGYNDGYENGYSDRDAEGNSLNFFGKIFFYIIVLIGFGFLLYILG